MHDSRQKEGILHNREDSGCLRALFGAKLIRDECLRVGENVDVVEADDFRTAVDVHYKFDFWLAETLKRKELDKNETLRGEFLGSDSKFWTQSIRKWLCKISFNICYA